MHQSDAYALPDDLHVHAVGRVVQNHKDYSWSTGIREDQSRFMRMVIASHRSCLGLWTCVAIT